MKQVDDYFRDALRHHESTVPHDMWDRIAPALEEERKIRPYFWLLVTSALVVLATLGYITYMHLTTTNDHQDRVAAISQLHQESKAADHLSVAEHIKPKIVLAADIVEPISKSKIQHIESRDEFKLVVTQSYFEGVEEIKKVKTTLPISRRSKRMVHELKPLALPLPSLVIDNRFGTNTMRP